MVFAYARVSTDRQEARNQRFGMAERAKKAGIEIDEYVEEVVTGTMSWKERRLGEMLAKMRCGDTLLVSEVSRLGRDYMDLVAIQSYCWHKGIKVMALKENYGGKACVQDIVVYFAASLSAMVERDMLSRRTKEALAAKKANGVRLGRPVGSVNRHHKLDGLEDMIACLLASGQSKAAVARKCKCHRHTIERHLQKEAKR